jgi:hypothetical protein
VIGVLVPWYKNSICSCGVASSPQAPNFSARDVATWLLPLLDWGLLSLVVVPMVLTSIPAGVFCSLLGIEVSLLTLLVASSSVTFCHVPFLNLCPFFVACSCCVVMPCLEDRQPLLKKGCCLEDHQCLVEKSKSFPSSM